MVGATIRGQCDHGEHCIMPGCTPVILMLQIDAPKDEAKLQDFITQVQPFLTSPLIGLQATPEEVKDLANNIMNVIFAFQMMKAHERFQKEHPEIPTNEDQFQHIEPMRDDNPFEDIRFYDYDDASWSDKA